MLGYTSPWAGTHPWAGTPDTHTKASYYHSQQSCSKVMFLHLSVSHSVHRRGVCLSASWDTHPSWAGTPPWADTPILGKYPPTMVTVADGTHPTGMLSCYFCWCLHFEVIPTFLPLRSIRRVFPTLSPVTTTFCLPQTSRLQYQKLQIRRVVAQITIPIIHRHQKSSRQSVSVQIK